jgi:hypothetical protein
MSVESLSSEDNAKLRYALEHGIKTTAEINALREGLRDVVKNVSKELQVPPRALRKAIRAAAKENFDEEKEEVENVEMILRLVGRR